MVLIKNYYLLIFASLFASPAQFAFADWPQFLGPNRDGSSGETGLTDSISEANVAWRKPGGVGMSAVAVAGNTAVTMWNEAGQQLVVAMDAKTGKRRWSTAIASTFKNQMGNGPRATPAIVDEAVYAYTGEGVLAALAITSGEILWKTDTVAELKAKPAEYGMSSSPLIVNDRVVVQVGAEQGAIAAYSIKDGKLAWTSGSATAAYSSPVLLKLAGVDQIVCMTGFGVHGLNPASGNELWSYPFPTPYDCNTACPVEVDGDLFISAGENHGCVLLEISRTAKGFDVTEKWSSLNTQSVMRNEWQTSVLHEGYLFGFDNVGSAGPVTHLTCINAQTGERVWREPRFGKGNLVLADEKLWITTMSGELVLVKADPKQYQELGRVKLFDKTRQSLSISKGFGYIRDDSEVICIKLK